MTILAINGYEYSTLPITKLEYSVEILDGPGTGRTSADLWPMFREPQGIIKNVYAEIWLPSTKSTNPNFTRLIKTLESFGTVDFLPVSFITPLGVITQPMYGASFKVELRHIRRDGVTYWGILPITFIAQKGKKG